MAAFYALATVIILTFLGGGITVPLLPIYAGSLGASLVQIAWIAGGYSTVSLVANLGWGRICDRLGRRKPFLVASMAVLTATSFLASLAGAWWVLLPLRLVEGGAFGAYGVASLAMLGDILEGNPHRPRLVGASRMSGSLAFSIAVVAAGLVSQSYGLPATYRAASGAYFLAFIVYLFLPESHHAPGGATGQDQPRRQQGPSGRLEEQRGELQAVAADRGEVGDREPALRAAKGCRVAGSGRAGRPRQLARWVGGQ